MTYQIYSMGDVLEMSDYKWCPKCERNRFTETWTCDRCGGPLEPTQR